MKNTESKLGPVAQNVYDFACQARTVLVSAIAEELSITTAQVFGALRTVKARGLVTVTKTKSGSFMVRVPAKTYAQRWVLVSPIGAYLGEGTATSRKDANAQGLALLTKLGRKRGRVNFR